MVNIQKKKEVRAARKQEISEAMAKMPKLIAEYRDSRKLDWALVTPLDKLLLTQGQIKEKYVRAVLSKGLS